MSLARRHKAYHEALRAGAGLPHAKGGFPSPPAAETPPGGEARLAQARLTHDLRRLKDIQSLTRKIDAKRDMLPEYAPYIASLLRAARETGQAVQDEVLPTIMVWSIDVGAWPYALELAEHVLTHKLALPSRFERTTACLIAEEVAVAMLKRLDAGEPADLGVLQHVEELVDGEDMPDEVRAKLLKAIGIEFVRQADAAEDEDGTAAIAGARVAMQAAALDRLKRAVHLDVRVGAKKHIEKLERALKAAPPAPANDSQSAPDAPATDATAAGDTPPAGEG